MSKESIVKDVLKSAGKMGQFSDDLSSFFGALVDMAEGAAPGEKDFCDVAPLLRVGEAAAMWYSHQAIAGVDGIRCDLRQLTDGEKK